MEELPEFVITNVFSYENEGIREFLSLFGEYIKGVGQKVMFWANKSKILTALESEFETQIQQMEQLIKNQLFTYQQEREKRCRVILINSYEKIVGKSDDLKDTLRVMKNTIDLFEETEKLDIGPLQRNEVPIRVFPLQKDNNGNKNWLSMGMLATKNNPNDIKVNIRDVFETIPDNVTEEDF